MIIVGLWYLGGIVSIILMFLFEYLFYKKDINFYVGYIVPTLGIAAFGPLVLVVGICQFISHITEKYQYISIFEIKQKRK